MSLASTRNSPLPVILCITPTSALDSMSTWLDKTASLPAPRSMSASASQSARRNSWRREHTVSPRYTTSTGVAAMAS